MKAETEEIVAALSELTKDEYYSLVGDAPYEIVVWEVDEKGPFTWENFLVDNQGLIPLQPADFLDRMGETQPETAIGPYENLLSLLQDKDLTIYGYRLVKLPGELQEGFPVESGWFGSLGIPMLICSSSSGEWIGLGLKQQFNFSESPVCVMPDRSSVSASTAQLVEQIQAIASQMEQKTKASENRLYVGNDWEIVVTDSREEVVQELLEKTGFLDINKIEDFMRVTDDYGRELEEINETIGELQEELQEIQKRGESGIEEAEEIQAELAATREEFKEFLNENEFELDFINFFGIELYDAKTYNFKFILGGEWCTVHYALGVSPFSGRVGVVTISYTV
ncbi:MAG: hypothetical protein AB4352_25340 [Hormoscilla sp.]